MINDTEILDWLEINSNRYLVVPPNYKGEDEPLWSMYDGGSGFVSSGKTIRECVINFIERYPNGNH